MKHIVGFSGGIDSQATAHGEQINPLYTLGFNRVGCAPCINSSKEDIRAWFDRAPEMIDKIRGWEQRIGRTFLSPCVAGLPASGGNNTIDQVFVPLVASFAYSTLRRAFE